MRGVKISETRIDFDSGDGVWSRNISDFDGMTDSDIESALDSFARQKINRRIGLIIWSRNPWNVHMLVTTRGREIEEWREAVLGERI